MSSVKWTLPPPGFIVCRLWDDEGVVYDTRNGDTHLLDPVTVIALEILSESAKDVHELAIGISSQITVPPGIDVLALTESSLQQLRRIGLIRPGTA